MKALLLLAALGLPSAAAAERSEIYAMLGLEPTLGSFLDAPTMTRSGRDLGTTVSTSGLYGLTNSIHVGVVLKASFFQNIRFDSVEMPSASEGMLFENHRSMGAGALLHYRVLTGYSWAPVFELETGGTYRFFTSMEHFPREANFGVPVESKHQVAPIGRLAVLAEYRFAQRYVLSVGASGAFSPGGLGGWLVSVPVQVGAIWW